MPFVLKMNEVTMATQWFNSASQKLFQKAGFEEFAREKSGWPPHRPYTQEDWDPTAHLMRIKNVVSYYSENVTASRSSLT
jgi:RimJ/RimL family protein N-acetyltransferase